MSEIEFSEKLKRELNDKMKNFFTDAFYKIDINLIALFVSLGN